MGKPQWAFRQNPVWKMVMDSNCLQSMVMDSTDSHDCWRKSKSSTFVVKVWNPKLSQSNFGWPVLSWKKGSFHDFWNSVGGLQVSPLNKISFPTMLYQETEQLRSKVQVMWVNGRILHPLQLEKTIKNSRGWGKYRYSLAQNFHNTKWPGIKKFIMKNMSCCRRNSSKANLRQAEVSEVSFRNNMRLMAKIRCLNWQQTKWVKHRERHVSDQNKSFGNPDAMKKSESLP